MNVKGRTFGPTSAIRVFLMGIWLILSSALMPLLAADRTIEIVTNPPGARVSVQIPKPQTCRAPCKITFDKAYFEKDGGRFLESARLEEPVLVTIDLEEYDSQEVLLTDGPEEWGRNLKPAFRRKYYVLREFKNSQISIDLVRTDYFAKGSEFLKAGRCEDAVKAYETSVRGNSKNAQGYFRLYEAYSCLKQVSRSIEMLSKAVDLAPDQLNWQLLLYELLIQTGNEEASGKLFEAVVPRLSGPDQIKMGKEEVKRGNLKRARYAFEVASSRYPSPDAFLSLADVLTELKDSTVAAATYEKVLATDSQNAEATNGAAKNYLVLANTELQNKAYDAALKHLDRVTSLGQALRPATRAEGWFLKYRAFSAFSSLDQYENSLNAARQVITIVAGKTDAQPQDRLWLGHSYWATGQYSKAIPFLREAAAVRGAADPEVLQRLSLSLIMQGSFKEALDAASAAAVMVPPPSRAYALRCRARLELKDREGALADCDKALSINPNDGEALYYKGLILEDSGKGGEAKKAYDAALANFKAYPFLDAYERYLQATITMLRGDYKAASQDFLEAVRLQPDFVKAIQNLTECFDALGQRIEYEKWYRMLLEKDPELARRPKR